jgi:two-component system response regulator NreC
MQAGPSSLSAERVRLLVCHDADAVRTALHALLDDAESVEVIGEARGARACLRLARERRPDVILLDLAMPVLDGLKTFKDLRTQCPDVPCVVMLSSFDARRFYNRLLELGATGCVDKSAPLDELLATLQFAVSGSHATI